MLPEHEGARVMAARMSLEAEVRARHRGFLQDLRGSAPTPTHDPGGSAGHPRRRLAGAVAVLGLVLVTWMAQDADARNTSVTEGQQSRVRPTPDTLRRARQWTCGSVSGEWSGDGVAAGRGVAGARGGSAASTASSEGAPGTPAASAAMATARLPWSASKLASLRLTRSANSPVTPHAK